MACNNSQTENSTINQETITNEKGESIKHFRGAITNGMKGDSLSFDLSADGKKISNLTFNGWWRCNGSLERQPAAGPTGEFDVIDSKVNAAIAEPPGGGSTAWRFELNATINGNKANGTFRMNINNLGCDTYVLKFDAETDNK